MQDYLIRQWDDNEYFLPYQIWGDVLRPSSFTSNVVEESGAFYLEVEGCRVTFSPEPPGLQISFGDCDIPAEVTERIVEEILASVESFTGQKGKIIHL